MKIRLVGTEFFHADRWTAVTKLIVAFCSLADTPESMAGLTTVWLVAFAQLGRAPTSFVMSVSPSVRPSVQLSACFSAVPTGPISLKFDIGNVYGNLSRKARFLKNWTKVTLREYLSTFFFVSGDI
jgi:hypothetical protein